MALRVYDTQTGFKKSDGAPKLLRPVTKGNLMKRNKLMCVKLILWYTEFAFGVAAARRHPCSAETLAAMIL